MLFGYDELETGIDMSNQDKWQSSLKKDYSFGFETKVDEFRLPNGLNRDIIRQISKIKSEPEFMLNFRLRAFEHWETMPIPMWSDVVHPPIDLNSLCYYSAPKEKKTLASLDEVDPEILRTYEKLGIPLHEQKMLQNVAVDAVFDSVSVATTFRQTLKDAGVLFCSMGEAIKDYPELIEQYLGRVVPMSDNYYACLNSAVFSDGSFVYVPKGVRCPMELSTYFRINAKNTGQFERTLIIAEAGSYVSYLEGCTAPMRDENQLHAAVVELIALEDAEIRYATVQNWYPGDENGKGGIYNFVTKRGLAEGARSKITWTQVETGSAITWKYPSVVLRGDDSQGAFYSVALTKNHQQADTGSKMIHMGKRTKSIIIAKGVAGGQSLNTYRGKIRMLPGAKDAHNITQCDSLLLSPLARANTHPRLEVQSTTARVEHEATTSKVAETQLLYCMARGLKSEDAMSLIVSGFCKEVFKHLPLEFAVEAQQLLALSLEGSIG